MARATTAAAVKAAEKPWAPSRSAAEAPTDMPIAVKVAGRYHDIGAFAADIAHLSRIVTLNNLEIAQGREGTLTMDATAKTFRYLDHDEVNAQRKATKGGKK